MPTSYHHNLTGMISWILKVQPASILDIGVGHGKWGFLSREYTDILGERYNRDQWKTRIEGVEGFRGYANPVYDYAYDHVYFGDARTVVPALGNYDLAIIGDAIEHFDKSDGLALLRTLKAKTQFILISSPTFFFNQEVEQNPFETHRSFWDWKDFSEFEFDYEEFPGGLFVALLRGSMPSNVSVRLDGRAARCIYSVPFMKKHSRFAQLLRRHARHLPRCKSWEVKASVLKS